MLHGIQDAWLHSAAAVPVIAEALNLSRAEVHGVVTFYHHFRQRRPAGTSFSVCQAEACRSMHCEHSDRARQAAARRRFHETTADGRFTLEPVYCLGNCACAPAMMIDGELHGRVTPRCTSMR